MGPRERRRGGSAGAKPPGSSLGVRRVEGRSEDRPLQSAIADILHEEAATMATVIDDVVGREARHVVQTYRRTAVTFVRGQGVRLYDATGREYLDLLSGIGVAALGHAHPALARALAEQAQTLVHTSNLFYHPFQGEVAERLATLSGLPRAFFCNSGTEAVEACLKFARRYWFTKGAPRAEFIALDESFHGRTFGSLSVTSDEHYRKPFEPLVPAVKFVPVNDGEALRSAVSQATAA